MKNLEVVLISIILNKDGMENTKEIYNVGERMIEQFIGVFPNVINDDACSEIVSCYNTITEQGLTMSSDEVVAVPAPLPHQCFPTDLCSPLWQALQECYNIYTTEYATNTDWFTEKFKVHRVQPSDGYYEHSLSNSHSANAQLVLDWMIILEVPEMGGEIEFLYQSIIVNPTIGQLLIWPAEFTHKHREKLPLKGQKTYAAGCFEETLAS